MRAFVTSITKLPKPIQSAMLFVVYAGIIFGTIFYSGRIVKKTTLYDRFIVALDGAIVPSSDIQRSLRFYTEVLDFRPVFSRNDPQASPVGVLLPEKRRLFFQLLPGVVQDKSRVDGKALPQAFGASIIIRVRNGFQTLHDRLLERSLHAVSSLSEDSYLTDFQALSLESVSQIVDLPWGKEFVVRDPDGNNLIFYQPDRRSGSRY